MMKLNMMIRRTQLRDRIAVYQLYKKTALISGGIARYNDEITHDYIDTFITKSIADGLSLVSIVNNEIIGEIHAYKPEIKVFSQLLSQLTICIHPQLQGKHYGKELFSEFMKIVQNEMQDIHRVELIARESNKKAIALYESLGFEIEGKFRKRICNTTGKFESDIPMGWIRKS